MIRLENKRIGGFGRNKLVEECSRCLDSLTQQYMNFHRSMQPCPVALTRYRLHRHLVIGVFVGFKMYGCGLTRLGQHAVTNDGLVISPRESDSEARPYSVIVYSSVFLRSH